MKKNVGTIDAIIRITLGLFGLAWSMSRMVRQPRQGIPFFIAFQSALKVAEGITRFCPGLYLLKMNTLDGCEKQRAAARPSSPSRRPRHIEPPSSPAMEKERGLL